MPKTKEQYSIIKDKKKKEIISSALYLFATEGYKCTSIDDIMERVGSTHSLFYHYFNSKEEVFCEIIKSLYDEFRKRIQELYGETNPDKRLEIVVSGILKMLDNPEYAQSVYICLTLYFYDPVAPRLNADVNTYGLYNFLYKTIEEGQEQGYFLEGNVKEYCVAIISIFQGLSLAAMNLKHEPITIPDAKIILNMVRKER